MNAFDSSPARHPPRGLPGSLPVHVHRLRHALGNFSLLKHRHCRGQFATMHQSGTHFLKFMLGHALSRHYDVAPPRYNHANDIIGGPKDRVVHSILPRLLCSHSIPHAAMYSALTHRALGLPRYVVLVRDIRASLVSNYEKWRTRYGCGFNEFLVGDPSGRRYTSDIWWCLRFLNGWARVAAAVPDRVLVLRYESLCADPAPELRRVAAHFGLPLDAADIAHGVAHGGKQTMLERSDPDRPPGIVNSGQRNIAGYYAERERAWLRDCCARWLDDDYGYDYAQWA